MYECTANHINNTAFLPIVQSSFRKHFSTTTALLQVTDEVLHAIDNLHVVIVVLLDLTKAFDLVYHGLLVAKMKYYNFSDYVV